MNNQTLGVPLQQASDEKAGYRIDAANHRVSYKKYKSNTEVTLSFTQLLNAKTLARFEETETLSELDGKPEEQRDEFVYQVFLSVLVSEIPGMAPMLPIHKAKRLIIARRMAVGLNNSFFTDVEMSNRLDKYLGEMDIQELHNFNEWLRKEMGMKLKVLKEELTKTLLKAETLLEKIPATLFAAVIEPLREFLSRPSALVFILVIILYKFGDALSVSLTTPFLIRGLGFSLVTVGSINKIFGMIASLLGVVIGGALMTRISLYRSLFLFGILQMVAILFLMALAVVGQNYALLVVTIFFDNLFNGMGTAALLAFLMSLCDQRYTATQYALFSAIASVPRVFIGPIAGVMVEHLGWPEFFVWSLVTCVPGLLALWFLRNKIGGVFSLSARGTTT